LFRTYLNRGVRYAAIFAAATLPCISVYALDPSETLAQYSHTSWSRLGSLPNTPVNTFQQTPDGYLWLGTEETGLIRFDGRRFVRWEGKSGQRLPAQSIGSLHSGSDGSLWIGTRKGLARLQNGDLGVFNTQDGLDSGAVTAIDEDQVGGIWAGTIGYHTGGLFHLEHGRFDPAFPAVGSVIGGVSALSRDRNGELWIGAAQGLFRWNSHSDTPSHQTSPRQITSLARGTDGSLWLATSTGLFKYADGVPELQKLLPRGTNVKPYPVLVDRDGGIWLGTLGQGLFHIRDRRIDRMTKANGLSSDLILGLYEDREGNIWVGTRGGVDRFSEYKIGRLSTPDGLPADNVVAVQTRGGQLCAGIATAGVYCLDDGRTRSLPNSSVLAIVQRHDGSLVASTIAGVFQLGPDDVHTIADLKGVYSLAEDKDGNLWLGDIYQGLFRTHAGKLSRVPSDQFSETTISGLLADRQGRVWIALNPGGLAVYERGSFHKFTSEHGLPDDHTSSVFEDHIGKIWVSTSSGLTLFDKGRFWSLTTRKGLPCNSIEDVIEDDLDYLWLRTTCGLIRIERAHLVTAMASGGAEIRYELFGPSDGFQPATLHRGSTPRVAKTSDGRLWFVATDGLAVVNPRHISRNTLPPPVHIEQIAVNGKRIDPGRTASLPPTLVRMQLDYTALSFTDPDRVFFKYKLDGFDRDWIDAGTQRQAFYTNLRPGAYQFHVIACNNDGIWNQTGATFSFIVESSFLQTRSFAWLCCLAGVGFLIGMYYLRLHGTPASLLRNTIKSYPTAIPGLGLLLLRVAIGVDLLTRSTLFNPFANTIVSSWSAMPRALEIASGILLMAGLATPIVGALLTSVVVLEMIQRAASDPAYASASGPWENALLYVILLGSLTLLGPGGFSLDAKVFGRRRITIVSHRAGG
jgi:ligand-binding sensor domain-containing protein/uncharacterized membrane protein YphA (DoxX/SURF4 family)